MRKSRYPVPTNEYNRVHEWLRYHFGKADKCIRKKCKKESNTFQWALKRGKNYEKNRNNFIKLCRSCHAKYDRKQRDSYTKECLNCQKKFQSIMPKIKVCSNVCAKALDLSTAPYFNISRKGV